MFLWFNPWKTPCIIVVKNVGRLSSCLVFRGREDEITDGLFLDYQTINWNSYPEKLSQSPIQYPPPFSVDELRKVEKKEFNYEDTES